MTRILVGIDGAPDALRAVHWAAQEAERTGGTLALTHVRAGSQDAAAARRVSAGILRDATADARGVWPGVRVECLSSTGDPAARLIALASTADIAVVGSRGRGGFARLLLGSVADQLARYAFCEVVVVRGERPVGPVVAGVDLDDHTEAVIAFALDHAALGDGRVVIVHASDAPDAGERVEGVVDPWKEKYPALSITTTVLPGAAAVNLADSSRAARLLVLGAGGTGSFGGLQVGSVTGHLLHVAHCPVAVVR